MSDKSFTTSAPIKRMLSALMLCLTLMLSVTAAAENDKYGVVLVFGDSLSAAYRMPEERGWVALLQDRMKAEGLPYRIVNASVSGETTGGGLARLPAMLAANNPDIVVLELGGNDGLRGLPVPSIRNNLEQMIALSQAAGAQVLLAGIQIPPNYGPRYTEPFYSQYQELADQYGLALIPFLLEGIAEDSTLMQDDGIHPTAEAQSIILEIVWPSLLKLLSPALIN
jgi:acyl-CoA thioesterase-1